MKKETETAEIKGVKLLKVKLKKENFIIFPKEKQKLSITN